MNPLKSKKTLALLAGPGFIFLLCFFFLPLIYVLMESFKSVDNNITLVRYFDVIKSQQFQLVFIRTLRIALIVTPIAVLVGYPSAYFISKLSSKKKSILTTLVILPLMKSLFSRIYDWIVILGKFEIFNPN